MTLSLGCTDPTGLDGGTGGGGETGTGGGATATGGGSTGTGGGDTGGGTGTGGGDTGGGTGGGATGGGTGGGATGGGTGGGSTATIAAPADPAATGGDAQVSLRWTAVAGATSYTVYYGTANGVNTAATTKLMGVTTVPALVTGLTNGTTYYFIVTSSDATGESAASGQLKAIPQLASATTFIPNDPLFVDQWHLRNTGQSGNGGGPGAMGADINVVSAWVHGQGNGVRIAIVDDGLDVTHPDLIENVIADQSYDYMTGGTSPTPDASSHGTGCAGLVAGSGNNGIGVTGVAMNAKLVGYNLLTMLTAANEADAMTRALNANQVYSNSWGATDGTGTTSPSASTWRAGIDQGLTTGRGGRGAIYTWAAGNGSPTDRSDYDGQATYQGVIAVGSLTNQGTKSSYSEEGSNVLVSAFGGEFCDTHTTTTTDVQAAAGYNNGNMATDYMGNANFTKCMNGTSAATPEVSGGVAMMLEANPNLNWREVRYLLAMSARKNDPTDSDWVNNGAGRPVNHKYGFGVLDVAAATTAARAWTGAVNLTAAQKTATGTAAPSAAIADNGVVLENTIALSASGMTGVEFVDVTVTSDHAEVGDLSISLISPAGTVSVLAVQHACSANMAAAPCGTLLASGNRFGVARLMGETVDGNWMIRVQDHAAGNTGSLVSWSLTVHGY